MKNHIFKILQYISYSIRAKDEYSLHSPFVYDFYANFIKRKKTLKGSKKQQILCHIKTYLADYDIVTLKELKDYDNIKNSIKNPFTILLIEGIHNSKKSLELKNQIINDDNHHITIDFFSVFLVINNPNIINNQNYILKK
jgi:hypothetical protein